MASKAKNKTDTKPKTSVRKVIPDNVDLKQITADQTADTPDNLKLGKGHKQCIECSAVIGARSATCKNCGHIYEFKGKQRYVLWIHNTNKNKQKKQAKKINQQKTKKRKKSTILDAILLERNPHLPKPKSVELNSTTETNAVLKSKVQTEHSQFMKEKQQFTNILPKENEPLNNETIKGYLEECELLLLCTKQQINAGDLNGSSKILNKICHNLLYLGTICDIDHLKEISQNINLNIPTHHNSTQLLTKPNYKSNT